MSSRKRAILTVAALAISVIFAAAVIAVEQKAPGPMAATATPKLDKGSGTVEKVDEAQKDFLVKTEKQEMTFYWADKTKFTEGKKALSFADLKQGLQVTVRYKKDGDKLIAQRISVGMPKAKQKM